MSYQSYDQLKGQLTVSTPVRPSILIKTFQKNSIVVFYWETNIESQKNICCSLINYELFFELNACPSDLIKTFHKKSVTYKELKSQHLKLPMRYYLNQNLTLNRHNETMRNNIKINNFLHILAYLSF